MSISHSRFGYSVHTSKPHEQSKVNQSNEQSIQYKVPHVCFSCDAASNFASKRDLMKVIGGYLSNKFENVSVIGYFPLRKQILVKLKNCSILLDFERSRFNDNEWVVLFGPVETPIIYNKSFIDTCDFIKDGLISVTCSFNEFLVNASNVHRIRWYFERGKYQSKAVRSPEELPW